MNSPHFLFWASGILGAASIFPYLYGIFKGHVIPERMTWFLWTILSGINLCNQWSLGAGPSLIFTTVATLNCACIYYISLYRGIGGSSRLDRICLGSGILGLSLWYATGNPLISLGINIAVDICALIPTLAKLRTKPHSENLTSYVIGSASALCTASSDRAIFTAILFPLYVSIANIALVLFALSMRHRTQNPHSAMHRVKLQT